MKPTVTTTVLGLAAVPLTFAIVGLTPVGPVAGGLFAAYQGAGIAAGSAMSIA